MDAARFDSLTRSLFAARSRRQTLGIVLGGAVVALGVTHADDATAGGKCKPTCDECETCDKGKCKKKNGKKVCKKGTCKPKVAGSPCTVPSGGSCQNGACACTGGLITCGGVCTDHLNDEGHCGACNRACPQGRICINGGAPRPTAKPLAPPAASA